MAEAKEQEHLNKIKNANVNNSATFIGLCDNICDYNYEFLDFNEGNRISWGSAYHNRTMKIQTQMISLPYFQENC